MWDFFIYKTLKVFNNIEYPAFTNPVVTIGVFDGVHLGHKQVINILNKKATEVKGETVIVTFWPHPRMVLKPSEKLELLSTIDEKTELLEKSGIKNLIIVPFTIEFASLSYRQFIREYLVKKIGVHTLIVGHDHQFGRNREGNFEKLTEFGLHYNFSIEKLEAEIIETEKVSSSVIRESLLKGEIEKANKYLGYNYNFSGYVIEGKKIGRSIGFPTANILLNDNNKLIPGSGVYAATVDYNGNLLKGMMNIGYRPTIVEENNIKTIEIHLFDFNENLYGKFLKVYAVRKIRNEKKFNSIDELKEQIVTDEATIRKILNK